MVVDPREMTPAARRAFRRRSAAIILSLLAIVVLIGGVSITLLSRIGVRDDVKNVRLRAAVTKVAPGDFTTGAITPSNPVSIALGVDPTALRFTSADGTAWCVKVTARHLLSSQTVWFTSDVAGRLTEVKSC